MRLRIILAAIFSFVLTATAAAPTSHFDGNSWWHYVSVLANDNMEGRETGSPGLARAQAYIVGELKKSGIEPAGDDGGFYQPVKFIEHSLDEKGSSLALVNNGQAEDLQLGEDAMLSTRVALAPSLEAPLAFVGYGLQIPEKNYDDLAGQDLHGKVAVFLSGHPPGIPGALAAHASSAEAQWNALKAAGAVGVIRLLDPANMDIPWSRMALNRAHPSMALAAPEFDVTLGEKLAAYVNPARANKLFAGSGHTFNEILELAKAQKPLPHFPLAVSIRSKADVHERELASNNIVAKLTGSDPKLKSEYVVLSAHIDHLGIGAPINGDRIYNGAMDNGSGSAALLDIAKSLANSQSRNEDKPRRSIIFLWVTGEEKGLLGSRYFAAHPTVEKSSIVADINMDMFLPIIPLKVMTVFGLAESDLGDWARAACESQGVGVQPDPEPERDAFIRSDQYSFIRQGVPAVAMDVGFTKETFPIQKAWLTNRYHAPSDDLNQPVDKQTAARYEEIARTLLLKTADAGSRPEWKQDSFFRRFAQQPAGAP